MKRSDTGAQQGGVLSPMLSNVFLHYVLDEWFERVVKPRLSGSCQLVRFADDVVMTFEDGHSGERMLAVLGKRLGRYGLVLNATKTRYVDFRPPRRHGHEPDRTFEFLGFTHVWGRSRRGNRVARQVTANSRYARAVKAAYDWCKRNRHLPIAQQQEHLARIIRGHCNYYGLTGNGKRLGWFRHQVIRSWRKWLSRRHRAGGLNWDRMNELLKRHPLPPAKVMRSIYTT